MLFLKWSRMKVTNKQFAKAFVTVVDELEGKDLNDASTAFIFHAFSRGELKRFRNILREIENIWKQKSGVATIIIETAHPLEASVRQALEKSAAGAEIREVVDPSLIGGIRLRIDDRIIDGSLSGSLKQLKKTLSE